MGKNKIKSFEPDPAKNKSQALEETKRISKAFEKNMPTKSK